jgi:hypothetical protein
METGNNNIDPFEHRDLPWLIAVGIVTVALVAVLAYWLR